MWYGNNRQYVHVNAPTASGGVGILVGDKLAEHYVVSEVDKSYNDILVMKFTHKISEFTFLVVSAYLPPETSPWGRDAASFYNYLLQTVYTYHDVDALFILGDFNARIANLQDFDDAIDVINKRIANIDDKVNGHGRSMIDFLLDSKLCVLNGRVSPITSNHYTFHSVRGLSVVDFILTPHDNLSICENFNIESCTDILNKIGQEQLVTPNSRIPDHSLLSINVNLSFAVLEGIDNHNYTNVMDMNDEFDEAMQRRYKTRYIPQEFLNSESVCQALQHIISRIECNRETQYELDCIYTSLVDLIIEEMNNFLLVPQSKHTRKRYRVRKPYWNSDLTDLWKCMHNCERDYLNYRGPRRVKLLFKSKFVQATYNFDKQLKRIKRQYDRGYLIDIEKLQTNNPSEFWRHISRLGPRSRKCIPLETILDDGSLTKDKNEVLSKWQYDYQMLYSNESDIYDNNFLLQCKNELHLKEQNILDPLYIHNTELNRNIETGELERILRNAKNKKAAGIDKIPYEIWKCPKLLPVVKHLFQLCLDIGRIPSDWSLAIISPIPKSNKADPRLPLSYRGISLLSCLYKLYSSFINSRLQTYIENNNVLEDEQNGFREGRSCEDHIYVMDTLINTQITNKKPVFACFIDFSKAFDLINRDQLMLQLLNKNIDGKIYWSLKSLYAHTSSCIKLNNLYTSYFDIHNGVRQGDPLSPTLFSLFIDSLIKEIKREGLGINIGDLIISILAYADDLVLISENEENLQCLLDIVSQWCRKWRLSINNAKSGVIHFRGNRVKQTTSKFLLAGREVNIVPEYKYLGVVLDEHLSYKPATKLLASAGGRALGSIIYKFKSFKDIGYDTYTKLFDSCVSPILEYGAGIWAPHKKFPDIDNVSLRACRYYLGVHKYAPIPGIIGDMGWVPNTVRRQVASCRFWNRLIRMDDTRLTKNVFKYDLQLNGKFTRFISDLCEQHNIDQSFTHRQLINLESIKQKAMLDYITDWKQDVSNKPKLRNYKHFKTEFGVENYVKTFLPKNKRSLIAQTRMSILPIRVETGRFVGEALDDRLCTICSSNAVEDESHVIFYCSGYEDLRAPAMQKMNMLELSISNDNDKLQYIYNTHPFILGNLLHKIMARRKSLLYVDASSL